MNFHLLILMACLILTLPKAAGANDRKPHDKKDYFKVSGLAFQSLDSDIGYKPTPNTALSSILNHDLSFKPGVGFTAAYGFRTDFRLNTELEFSARWASLDELKVPGGTLPADGDVRTFSFMLNIPWMFRNRTRWTPYMGGGIGMAWHKGDISPLADGSAGASEGQELTMAYQLLAGVSYAVNRRLEFLVGYKFFGAIDAQLGILQLQNRSHNIEMGIRWYLPEKKKKRKKVRRTQGRRGYRKSRY